MYRKLAIALALMGTAASVPASPAAASVYWPRTAVVTETVYRGSSLVVATGEAIEVNSNAGNAWTSVAVTCQGAQQSAPPLFVTGANAVGGDESLKVLCWLRDDTDDVDYMVSGYVLGLPADAVWGVWDIPVDHSFHLCLWTGTDGQYDMIKTQGTCVPLR